MKIGLVGGTFDPIHNGHLIISEEIADHFKLNKIIFIPAAVSPHKKRNKSMVRHRLNMTMMGALANNRFEVSSYETDKGGVSYSIDTVRHMKRLYGKEVDFYFIVGSDAFADIGEWKNARKIFHEINFIIAFREGGGIGSIMETLEKKVTSRFGSPTFSLHQRKGVKHTRIAVSGSKLNLFLIPTTRIDISSTQVRNRIKSEESIKYFVPDLVRTYIEKNRLYR